MDEESILVSRESYNRAIELAKNEVRDEFKEKLQRKIIEIVNSTLPAPTFKPYSHWEGRDYERMFKTQPLLELLTEVEYEENNRA